MGGVGGIYSNNLFDSCEIIWSGRKDLLIHRSSNLNSNWTQDLKKLLLVVIIIHAVFF